MKILKKWEHYLMIFTGKVLNQEVTRLECACYERRIKKKVKEFHNLPKGKIT